MSDQLNQPQTQGQLTLKDGSTINVQDIDPAIAAHFQAQTKPLVDKRDELLNSVNNLKAFKNVVDDLGGLDAVQALKEAAERSKAEAEAVRQSKLSADERLAEIEANYKREIAAREDKLTKWQRQALDRAVDSALADAIRAEDGEPALLSHAMKSRIEATMDDDGNLSIKVKGSNGNNLDENGKEFTLKGLVSEFKANEIFAAGFKATPSSGGGTRRPGQVIAGDNPWAKNSVNITKQMEMIKNSPDVARALATAAGEKADW